MSDGPPPLTRYDIALGLEYIREHVPTSWLIQVFDHVKDEYNRLTTLEKDWDEYWRGTTFAEHVAIQKARPTPPENTI